MRKITFFIVYCLLALAAKSATLDSLVAEFDAKGKYETANTFFAQIHRSGLLSTPLQVTAKTPTDTVRQQFWYWAAEYYYAVADYEQTLAYAQRALPLIQKGSELEADCQNLLAITNVRLCHYSDAARYAERCHELDVASGDESRISSSLNTLSGIYLSAGQPKEAEQYVVRGVNMARKSGDDCRLAVLLGMASEVYHALQRDTLALQFIDEAYRLDSIGGRTNRLYTRLAQRASVLIGLQRYSEAERVLGDVIPYLREIGDRHSLGIALTKMGEALYRQGRTKGCIKPYQESAEIFARLGDPYNEIQAHRGLYEALWQTNPELAKLHFDRFAALKDTIYTHSSAESLAHYSAKFGNDWLTLENHAERRARYIAIAIAAFFAFSALCVILWMHCRNRRQVQLNAKLQAVLEELRHEERQGGENADAAGEDDDFMRRTLEVINRQLSSGQLGVLSIASQLNMSPFQFRHQLSKHTDEKAQNLILRLRMERACHLLKTRPELNIQEVASLCGYSETANFTRAFKKFTGKTPSAY